MVLTRYYPDIPGGWSASGTGFAPPAITVRGALSGGYSSVTPTYGLRNYDNVFSVEHNVKGATLLQGVRFRYARPFAWSAVNAYNAITSRQVAPSPPTNLAAQLLQLAAGSNPTRPVVKLPVALFELRELPMMIHQAGAILSNGRKLDTRGRYWRHLTPEQRAASTHLAIEFGWKPLLSDLVSMVTLSDAVEKRRKEWDKLMQGGLRRRVQLWSGKGFHLESIYDYNYGITMLIKSEGVTNVWGTIKWKPAAAFPFNGRPPDNYIRRQLLGLTSPSIASNLWEALPWSWLIDWFAGFGTFLQAHQGKGLVIPSSPCVMTTRQTIQSVNSQHTAWNNYPGDTVREDRGQSSTSSINQIVGSKTRQIGSLPSLPQAWLPHLSGSQLSILGALHITRARTARV